MTKRPLFLVLFVCFLHVAIAVCQSLLQSGPMAGYGQMTEVMLWVQTTKSTTVQFRYWPIGAAKKKVVSEKISSTAEKAFTAHVLIRNLSPGTKYEYELLLGGKLEKRAYPLRFQTQPLWQWRTDPPEFSVAVASCFYVNETEWDRPGKPYGQHHEILSKLVEKSPDIMLWLGDNVYYREVDWHSVEGLRHRYTHTRSFPELQPLLGSVHHYAIWDDHDYGPNDADRSYRLKEEALETFRLFWGNQTYGTRETPGVFQRFEWADVEFFMLDDRYHRSPNRAPDNEEKTMFGKAQLQWLIDALASSSATFKIIAGGNQMLNPFHYYEAFSDYTHEYRQLIDFIKQQKVRGVLFLSGDRHHTELIKLADTTFYPLYDFTSSPLTAGLGNPEKEINNPSRVPGTLVSDAQNFGLLRFSGKRTDRKITLESWDYTGKLRWSHDIRASELRAPSN
ncbi:MAG: alkaline phosphatase D family protein [Ignavibacteriales bacterium]|nr:alkaline phosphatase D family protein [Ignavibacteriales bacterium]